MTSRGSYKIVIVGSSGVGKSSIVQRFVTGEFVEDGSTCGADFYTYSIPIENENIKLQIWDTAGQERFRAISKSYFRNSVGAILVYDITNIRSFDQLTSWLSDLQSLCSPNAYILVVGNKVDLEESRQVSAQQVQNFAEMHNLATMETSAKNGSNIELAFTRLAFEIHKRLSNGQISINSKVSQPLQVTLEPEDKKEKKCC
ncbi:Ras-related protein Rab-4B [Histomonas meleagridis]|uniref:Ras-related protein Rab-4B n=1 Tax=Histomonas meleagridis TaxID=135588 RepID=UPI003559BA17|nr:Ras-related protein Rab-4B [Histomonas meleagridis]KAH0802086.1 Ras-related protein Rab-4B [Histomonas meleagridis]